MKKEMTKPPKIAICRRCGGSGLWRHTGSDGTPVFEQCPQCEGSGRVTVSAKMEFDIRPYRQKER